jgi:superfamily II DNA helicase RecQ
MRLYAENLDCRREYLLTCFGEAMTSSRYGNCDNCEGEGTERARLIAAAVRTPPHWKPACRRFDQRENHVSTQKKSTGSKGKVDKTMHEFKQGDLKSGSGGKVKSRKQAIAIGLNEAREAGEEVPVKKSASKKSASKKAVTKKSKTKKK